VRAACARTTSAKLLHVSPVHHHAPDSYTHTKALPLIPSPPARPVECEWEGEGTNTHPVCTSPRPASPGSGARAQLNRGFSVSSASGRSAYSTVTAHPDGDAPMSTSPRPYRHVPSARHAVVVSRCARLHGNNRPSGFTQRQSISQYVQR
jgi:hypothetical protein